MHRYRFLVMAALMIVSVLIAAGCKHDDRVKISSILERPEKYMDDDVIVAGEVTKTYSMNLILAEAGAYQIDDGSGKIWVITKTGVPREGSKVGLKGTVGSGIKIGRDLFGAVIRERERKTRD